MMRYVKRYFKAYLYLATLIIPLAGCGRGGQTSSVAAASTSTSIANDPCAIALAPHQGSDQVDQDITHAQEQARSARSTDAAWERLGWLYVSKARGSFDPGYYKLAEQAALCLDSKSPGSPDALLLRGHVLDSLHRFHDAEEIARKLVASRETPFDYGLLGDTLMEQGRLEEATDAYQKMVDLKPDLQSYARAAHMRWLKGDLASAIQFARMAASAGSPRDPNSLAWIETRLSSYQLQAGHLDESSASCDAALRHSSDYAPALLARGRILLAQDKNAEAIEPLGRAAELNPLPEYHWALAEALRAANRDAEAREVESQLAARGEVDDPRTYSLYLSTRREQTDVALRLAAQELKNRADVFTLDAHAWALAATGRATEARAESRRSLAEGTKDARLFYHAGAIARAAGDEREARRLLALATSLQQTLLPSERDDLAKLNASPTGDAVNKEGRRTKVAR
ncbi:MAG: hypothetical protein QOE33_247 [Acidobacteriota bacterium]|nr:hypothetical protein [Acidobacteriota bacterium]